MEKCLDENVPVDVVDLALKIFPSIRDLDSVLHTHTPSFMKKMIAYTLRQPSMKEVWEAIVTRGWSSIRVDLLIKNGVRDLCRNEDQFNHIKRFEFKKTIVSNMNSWRMKCEKCGIYSQFYSSSMKECDFCLGLIE